MSHSVFSHIVGNSHAKSYLTRIVEKNTVPQSLLFSGPDGIGKALFAEAFARLIFKVPETTPLSTAHPDYHVYRPEGKIGMHSMDSVRSFSEDVFVPPYVAQHKVLVVHDADRMLTYSANALLKAFEEPAPHSIIILLSRTPEALLPTVRSRCYQIRFHPLTTKEICHLLMKKWNRSPEDARTVAELAQGSLGNALQIIQQPDHENSIKHCLLRLLACGPVFYYPQLVDIAKEISEQIEQDQKPLEEAMREELVKNYPAGVTSAQQHVLDQEIAGALTLYTTRQVDRIFDTVLGWYRDLHLLQVNGDRSQLCHNSYHEQLVQVLQRGSLRPLDSVLKAVSDARLAFARFIPLPLILENLLLH